MFEELGLVQLGRKTPKIVPSDELYVVGAHHFDKYTDRRNQNVFANFEELVRNNERPVLFLDMSFYLDPSHGPTIMDRYATLNPRGPRYFMPCDVNHHVVVDPSSVQRLEEIIQVIDSFHAEKVHLGGFMTSAIEYLAKMLPQGEVDEDINLWFPSLA